MVSHFCPTEMSQFLKNKHFSLGRYTFSKTCPKTYQVVCWQKQEFIREKYKGI